MIRPAVFYCCYCVCAAQLTRDVLTIAKFLVISFWLQGSPGYWPPEVLEHRPFNPRTADVWALGVTLHVLLTSRLPFGGGSDVDVEEDHALTMMRRGLDLSSSGPSRSVRLSVPVVELLRGLLHYVTEVS